MKTIPPACPEPETGRRYWKSLDQVSDTPEFREWLEREFPAGASEFTDPVSRRHFVKIMSASFALAGLGLTGCRRPEHKLEPFAKQPEGYIHGVAQHFATAMPTRGSAIPLVVKAHEGRPVKVEGNPLHPDSNGGTDAFTQASILDLYDPDRSYRILKSGNSAPVAEAQDFLASTGKTFAANQGEGLAFLVEPSSSPSRARLQQEIAKKLPKARWHSYEPIGFDLSQVVASEVSGKSVRPYYKFDAAKVVVSLDCDFLGTELEAQNHIRRFAAGRRIEKPEDTMNRLYVIESLMTLTGVNADHRLRLASSAVLGAASALGKAAGVSVPDVTAEGLDAEWISECAKDLAAHKGESLVVAGAAQSPAVHAIALAINAALGNVGKTVLFHEVPVAVGSLEDLAAALTAGSVNTLVVLGGNPAHTAPAQLNWAQTQRKAKTVIRLGVSEDETSEGVDWHLPLAHYLESWGDARTADGTLVPVQPLIAPLFGGWTELEVLARLLGLANPGAYEVTRATFAGIVGGGDVEGAWRKFLHDGFLAGSAARAVNISVDSSKVSSLVSSTKAADQGLEVVFRRDASLDDGRFSNNGWMQELPDPITKIVWDNVVSVSRKTARELNCVNGDVVSIEAGGRSVEGPIWVQPGMADNVLGLALGYGRTKTGRVGRNTGFNAYALRTSETRGVVTGVKVTRTGRTHQISCTQDHWSMQGRPIIREANLSQFKEHPEFVKSLNLHEPPVVESLYPNPMDAEGVKSKLHQWGMSVDLNMCVGCSACVIACQSENNIPIVGKDQVSRGREMHWLRLDRYYATTAELSKSKSRLKPDEHQQFEEWIDDVQVVTQPMMCQHCESAPCESVCPVNATVHDSEGLNVMAYNRCVGTRYCSNNCPYKVRRFNYFDYNKRPNNYGEVKGSRFFGRGSLYEGPFGKRPEDEWDLIKLAKNPEVSVRMRGVMEKCTFCTQRIESAKIARKVAAGASGDIQVPDGTIKTACEQACPAGAIVFGNVADPNSRVSKLKQQLRDYSVLEFLLTKPRLTYLARVRNPNPAMPDYHEAPLTLQEYEARMEVDDAFESHGGEHGTGHDDGQAEPVAHGAEKGAH